MDPIFFFNSGSDIKITLFHEIVFTKNWIPYWWPRVLFRFQDAPQAAVFDTAYYASMPDYAYMYPVPYTWYSEHGVRKYGFHGTRSGFVIRAVASLKSTFSTLSQFLSFFSSFHILKVIIFLYWIHLVKTTFRHYKLCQLAAVYLGRPVEAVNIVSCHILVCMW